MFRKSVVFVAALILVLFFHEENIVNANIHRAVPGSIPANVVKTPKLRSDILIDEIDEDEPAYGFFERIQSKADISWFYAILASVVVGSTGIFPLFIFKVEDKQSLKEAISPNHLKLLLSFAVGGLLGDVFLHLLPEAWMYVKDSDSHSVHIKIGLWVIAGLLSFMIIEKIFMEEEKVREHMENKKECEINILQLKDVHHTSKLKSGINNGLINGHIKNGYVNDVIGHVNGVGNSHADIRKRKQSIEDSDKIATMKDKEGEKEEYSQEEIKVIGYLNLLANCSDNFTHGLAVAGSFIVSTPVGICTTIAIMMHEIPHEIGDFAILLKAGFKRWEAAKGQILTASGAVFGCLFGLIAESAGDASAWILPFTAGGFIYIAMVTLVPDLVKEEDSRESLKQIMFLLLGIACMGYVSTIQH